MTEFDVGIEETNCNAVEINDNYIACYIVIVIILDILLYNFCE